MLIKLSIFLRKHKGVELICLPKHFIKLSYYLQCFIVLVKPEKKNNSMNHSEPIDPL